MANSKIVLTLEPEEYRLLRKTLGDHTESMNQAVRDSRPGGPRADAFDYKRRKELSDESKAIKAILNNI